jgi:hypothetical protein
VVGKNAKAAKWALCNPGGCFKLDALNYRRLVPLLLGLSLALRVETARADSAPTPARIFGTAALLLMPSDIGVLSSEDGVDLALGWSGQLPIGLHHRLVAGLDWNPTSDHHLLRGRLGYRYAWRYPFLGAGLTADSSGITLSPEFGVRFFHTQPSVREANPALHLLARIDVSPPADARALTLLFGWTWF